MGVSIGASLAGARAFTASSSNGLAYMIENIMVAGFYRLPIVMVAVNRTLGPPWNIWVDQGDTLMLRDFPWMQLYCETNQEVADTTLLAFRLAEDRRILLPVMVAMDAFIVSHTQTEIELPEQELVDRYLPPLDLPHRLGPKRPVTVGGLAWPHETAAQRLEHRRGHGAGAGGVRRVPGRFRARSSAATRAAPSRPIEVEDAETILVATGTIATTAREVVRRRRAAGEKVGLIKIKLFRPFPEEAIRRACRAARRVGVLDRNYAAGQGGIFWQDTRAAFQGRRDDLLIQDYLTGLCGGDVTPAMIEEVLRDLAGRDRAGSPVWMGVEAAKEAH